MATLEELVGKLSYQYDASALRTAIADQGNLSKASELARKELANQEAAAKKAADGMRGFGGSLKEGGVHLGNINASFKQVAVAAGAAGAAITGSLGLAVKSAMEFGSAMREVSTLTPVVAENLGDYKEQVLAVSAAMGINAVDAAHAMYQAISAGVKPEGITEFLEIAGKTAIGGVTDMTTAVDGLTTATNAWASQGLTAERASDILFAGMKAGKTTVGELSASMFQVAPIANAMGVSMDQVIAATATLTKSGTPTSVAMNQVRASLVALTKGGDGLAPLLENIAAKFPEMEDATGQAALDTLGYSKTMQELARAADELGVSLPTAFGRVEGAMAATTLSENAEVAAADLDAITNSAGATAEAYALMEQSASHKMKVFKETMNATAIGIGEAMLPAIAAVAGAVTGLMETFSGLSPTAKAAIAWTAALSGGALLLVAGVAGLAAAFGPLIIAAQTGGLAIGGTAITMGTLSAAAGTLVASLAAVLGPLALIAAAVAVVHNEQSKWHATLDEEAGKMDAAGMSLESFSAKLTDVAGKQSGLSKLEFAGKQHGDIVQATDAWLKYGKGVSDVVIQSAGFKRESKDVERALLDGKIGVQEYQQRMVALASSYSEAAGMGAVLSESERKVAASVKASADAMLAKDQATADAIGQDSTYLTLVQTLSDGVARGGVSQQQATANIQAYIDTRRDQIAADNEAAQVTAELAGATHTYSKGFADLTMAGKGWIADEEEMAKARAKASEDWREGGTEAIAEIWQGTQDYYTKLEEARAKDAANVAAAARQNAENEGKRSKDAAENAYKIQQANEKIAKAQEKGDGLAVAKYQEDIANLQGLVDTKYQIVTASATAEQEKVKAEYRKTVEAQKQALAEMVVNHVLNLALMGDVSEKNATRIFGSLKSAFPGMEVVSPTQEAFLQLNTTIAQSVDGDEEAIARLGTSINGIANLDVGADKVTGSLVEIDESINATEAEWVASYDEMVAGQDKQAAAAEADANRIIAAHEAQGASTTALGALHGAETAGMLIGTEDLADGVATASGRQIAAHGNLGASVTEVGQTTGSKLDTMRSNWAQTSTDVAIASEDIQTSTYALGNAAMDAGSTVSGGLSNIGIEYQTLAATMSEAATVAEGAGPRVGAAWAAGAATANMGLYDLVGGLDLVEGAQDSTAEAAKGAATDTTKGAMDVKKAEQDIVRSHDAAASAAEDHGDAVVDSMGEAAEAMDGEAESAENLKEQIESIPKEWLTNLRLGKYEETLAKIKTLKQWLDTLNVAVTVTINGGREAPISPPVIEDPTKPKDPPLRAPGQRGQDAADAIGAVRELDGLLSRSRTLSMDYEGTDGAAWSPSIDIVHAIEALDEWLSDPFILQVMMGGPDADMFRQFVSGEAVANLYAASAALADFESSMVGLGPIIEELAAFLFVGGKGTMAEMVSEWERFNRQTQGVSAMFPGGVSPLVDTAELQEYQDAITAAMDAQDPEALKDAWAEYYEMVKRLENERYQQEVDNLDTAIENAEKRKDTEEVDKLKSQKEGASERHSDFMADMDREKDAIADLYDDWNKETKKQKDLEKDVEDARKAALKVLKEQQDALEDAAETLHDNVLGFIDDEEQAIQDRYDIEMAALDRRRAELERQHDAQMTFLEDEKDASESALKMAQDALEATEDQIRELDSQIVAIQKQLGLAPMTDYERAMAAVEARLKQRLLDIDNAKQDLDDILGSLPKWDESKFKPKKKKETGIPWMKMTEGMRDPLQELIDSGELTGALPGTDEFDFLSTAMNLLAGRRVKADKVRELFEWLAKKQKTGAEDAKDQAQRERDEINKTKLAALEADKVRLRGIKERQAAEVAYWTTEDTRRQQAIDAETKRYTDALAFMDAQESAIEDRYNTEMDAIERARSAEDARHAARMAQILAEYAAQQMLLEGKTPEQVRADMAAKAALIQQLMADAQVIATDAMEKARQDAENARVQRENAIAREMAEQSGIEWGTGGTKGSILPGGEIPGEIPGLIGPGPIEPPKPAPPMPPGTNAVGLLNAATETMYLIVSDLRDVTTATQQGGGVAGSVTLNNYGTITMGGEAASEFESGILDFVGAVA